MSSSGSSRAEREGRLRSMDLRQKRPVSSLALLSVFAVALGAGVLGFIDERNLTVLPPLLAIVGLAWGLLLIVRGRSNSPFPVFEVGVVYACVVTLYAAYPLVAYIANGLTSTPAGDFRLFDASPQVVGRVGWFYVVHLASFVGSYLLVRGRQASGHRVPAVPNRTVLVVALFAYLAIQIFFLSLRSFFDLSAGSYLESYLAFARLPLLIAQLANHLRGAQLTLSLVILAYLFGHFRRLRYLILGWLAIVLVATVVRLGSRTELVLFALSSAMIYHYIVKPVRPRTALLVGLVGLILFTYLGIFRSQEGKLTPEYITNPFYHSSEFETLFANALDVARLKEEGSMSDLPLALRLTDLYGLVPQQLMTVEKISPSRWYVTRFYPEYAHRGGGLAFGTITESILGWGWIDLILRGATLGIILGKIHKYYLRNYASTWVFLFYIWVSVLSYQLFRSTTFSLLTMFVYQFLPTVLVVSTLSSIVKGSLRRAPLPTYPLRG